MKNRTLYFPPQALSPSRESLYAQKVFACISKFHFQTPTVLQRASFRVCVHIVHTPSPGTSSSSSPPERPWASRAGVSSWQHSFTQAATAGCNLHIPLKFDLCYRTPKGAVKRIRRARRHSHADAMQRLLIMTHKFPNDSHRIFDLRQTNLHSSSLDLSLKSEGRKFTCCLSSQQIEDRKDALLSLDCIEKD